jgi:hypothetical protein
MARPSDIFSPGEKMYSTLLFLLSASVIAPPVRWKSAQELTVINAGPWPVSEPEAGGMLRRLPFAAKAVVRYVVVLQGGGFGVVFGVRIGRGAAHMQRFNPPNFVRTVPTTLFKSWFHATF